MSIVFLFDENPDVASAGLGGAAVGGARSVPDHAVGSRWQPVFGSSDWWIRKWFQDLATVSTLVKI